MVFSNVAMIGIDFEILNHNIHTISCYVFKKQTKKFKIMHLFGKKKSPLGKRRLHIHNFSTEIAAKIGGKLSASKFGGKNLVPRIWREKFGTKNLEGKSRMNMNMNNLLI